MVDVPDKSPDRIASMFDAIAPRYDLLNHILTAGIDRRWRARAIRSLGLTGREVLAQEALTFGLANRVVPKDRLMAEAEQLALQLSALPQQCLRNDRRSAQQVAQNPTSGG